MRSLHYVDGDYADPTTFQELKVQLDKVGAKAPAHYLAIPPSLFGKVIESLGKSRRGGERPGDRREAVRPRPRERDRAQPDHPHRVPGVVRLPDRPLPREGRGPEHPLLPVRQLVPRADLEPQLHLEHPDHDGRGLRRAGSRRVLRRGRLPARRRAEPPLPGGRAARDGAAPGHGRQGAARREGAGVRRGQQARAVGRRPGPVRGLPQRARASRRTRTSRRSRRCACTSTRGAGPAFRGSCARARSCPST